MAGTQIRESPVPPVFSGTGHLATSIDERSHIQTTRHFKQPRLRPTPSGYCPRQQTPSHHQRRELPADRQAHRKQSRLSLVIILKAEQLPNEFILKDQNLISNCWLPDVHLQSQPSNNQRKPILSLSQSQERHSLPQASASIRAL